MLDRNKIVIVSVMTQAKKDPVREERIIYEAIVDCYNESEVAMG